MPDDKAVKKEIIAIKVKARIPQQYSSGLIVIYADHSRASLLGAFALVVLGQELAAKSLSLPHDKIIEVIRDGAHKYETNVDIQNKLRRSLDSNVNQDVMKTLLGFIEGDDPGSSENLIKRTMERILSISKIEIQIEYEYIGKKEFAVIKADDEIEKSTFSQKLQAVLPYAGNARDIAEKIIRENIRDVAIIRVRFKKGEEFFGCGLMLFSVLNSTMPRVAVAAGGNPVFNDPSIDDSLLDFFDDMAELSLDDHLDQAQCSAIETGLRKIDFARLEESLGKENRAGVNDLIFNVLRGVIGDGVEGNAEFELMNSLRMEFLFKPSRLRKSEEKAPVKTDDEFRGLKVINVDLLLSPTRGKNLSSIKPGENVQVLLDSSSPLAMKIIKGLNLVAGDKVKPIGAMVHSIKHHPKSGYKLYVKIAGEVLGKAEEEQDVKIRMGDPVVEEEIRKSQSSMIIGIIAGVAVLAILFLVLLLR